MTIPPRDTNRQDARPAMRPRRSLSQHDGVADWCDCCPCEVEPYWAEVAQELGLEIDDGRLDPLYRR